LQNLVGQHPKPFNNFSEIGYTPKMLIFTKAVICQSRFFAFFLFGIFFAVGVRENSLHRHGAKIGAEIVRAELVHSLFDDSKLMFVYKEFDLYRSLAICGIWHNPFSSFTNKVFGRMIQFK